MNNNSRTNWAGKLCPICHSGKLFERSTLGLLAGTVECGYCGAILSRFTSEDVENGYDAI